MSRSPGSVWRRFQRLPPSRRALLLRVAPLVLLLQMVVWIVPFAVLKRLMVTAPRPASGECTMDAHDIAAHDTAWAVEAAGRFRAHAWVECCGRVLVGGNVPDSYTPFPAFSGERA